MHDALMTYPLKKALIQLMMSVLGIIMAMLFFIMLIMPSIWLGSLSGLAGGWPWRSGSLRKAPDS